MHLYAITRGIKHDVDRMITELQGKYMPITLNGKPDNLVQLAVRPIQLWEFVFPDTQLGVMIATLPIDYHKIGEMQRKILRTALGAQPVPKEMDLSKKAPIYKDNVAIELIGIRKDEFDKDGNELL